MKRSYQKAAFDVHSTIIDVDASDEGQHWKKFTNDIKTNDEEFFKRHFQK